MRNFFQIFLGGARLVLSVCAQGYALVRCAARIEPMIYVAALMLKNDV